TERSLARSIVRLRIDRQTQILERERTAVHHQAMELGVVDVVILRSMVVPGIIAARSDRRITHFDRAGLIVLEWVVRSVVVRVAIDEQDWPAECAKLGDDRVDERLVVRDVASRLAI